MGSKAEGDYKFLVLSGEVVLKALIQEFLNQIFLVMTGNPAE